MAQRNVAAHTCCDATHVMYSCGQGAISALESPWVGGIELEALDRLYLGKTHVSKSLNPKPQVPILRRKGLASKKAPRALLE